MWVVRWGSARFNAFCLAAGHTKGIADQRGAEQIDRGVAELNAFVQSARSGENVRSNKRRLFSKEQRARQLAAYLSAEAEREIVALGNVLRDALSVTYPKDWAGLRDNSAYPVPAPQVPSPEAAPPEPMRDAHIARLLSWCSPANRSVYLAEAEEHYKAAHDAWERSKAAVEERNRQAPERHERELAAWEAKRKAWVEDQARRNAAIDKLEAAYSRSDPTTVTEYCRARLVASPYPFVVASRPDIALAEEFTETPLFSEYADTFPRDLELDYIHRTRTLVVEYPLPAKEALPSAKGYRSTQTGDKIAPVQVARSWLSETYDSVLYQVTLRTIYEILRWDEAGGALDSVVFNGWIKSNDKATGKEVNACVLTIQVSKREFLEINLAAVEPKACFRKLKGISAASLAAMSAVRPILQMDREDKRFVASRPVIGELDGSTNLAAMDWEDFEQLIRDVFEREFSGGGGEVKITRASRDHGVDAVAFDPDPIRGGKIVIQAKRYTDTVSVSAVRDLYGTILNEGANKGILVTTADYGPDAYEFAKGKPITLLNGSELLYLLQKHGRKARIDLAEARRLSVDKDKGHGDVPGHP